jgi:D-3-phosphoglycerate dehydrogenase / 2-oxoglutarate reductase
MMMALSRNIAPANQSLIEGRWERNRYMGTQLADKTIGIVGLGRIGQAVAVRCRAMEMRVLGYDPFVTQERARELGVEMFVTVPEMLPHVDYLTVHTPLTPETRNLIGPKEIDLLRPGVRLINCARGGIYDEAALLEGLRAGKLGGVALDVFTQEPCTSSPLYGMPHVLCTPHLGASTEEAQTQVAAEGAQLLIDFLTTGAIRHAVNVVSIDPKKLAGLQDDLDVAYRLGLVLAQLDRTPAKACRLTYRGEVAGKDTKLLTATVAAGLLQQSLEDEINFVNAEVLLRERGIELTEQSSSQRGAFSSVITAELTTQSRAYKVAGTFFGHKMARLVQIDDYRLDAFLDGVLLIFTHRDVPGIIGTVGTIFGQHGVNIAQMAVGRARPGGDAIGVLNLDSRPPAEAVNEVSAHPDILSVSIIELPAAGELPPWLAG